MSRHGGTHQKLEQTLQYRATAILLSIFVQDQGARQAATGSRERYAYDPPNITQWRRQ